MNRKALISLAIEQGQSGQVVGEILDVICAHPDLIDLPRMVAGLLRALRISELGSPIRIGNCDPLVWREACMWIVSLSRQPQISERLGNRFWLGTPPPTRNPVLSRGVKKYGFPYAALWHAPRDTENAPDYDRLVAQLLAATQPPSQSPLSAQRYAAFLDLRWLCEARHLIIPPELRVWGGHGQLRGGMSRFLSTRFQVGECGSVRFYYSIGSLQSGGGAADEVERGWQPRQTRKIGYSGANAFHC